MWGFEPKGGEAGGGPSGGARGAQSEGAVGTVWAGAVRQVRAWCDQAAGSGPPPCKARTLSRVHGEAVLPAGDQAARAASSAS